VSDGNKEFAKRVPAARAEIWRSGRPPLARLDFELTERCNNDCVHCSVNLPAGDGDARRRESTAAEIREILAAAASLGCLAVRFTGGEPLLRDDFEAVYLAARKLGLRVRIFTNATLITPRLAALLKKIPPLEEIEVSVYGMSPESSAVVTRNPAAFGAARRGLDLLVENGVRFVVKGALLPAILGEMDRFEAWAKTLPGRNGRPSYSMLLDLRSRRDDESKNGRIREMRVAPPEFVRLSSRWGEEQASELRSFVAARAGVPGHFLFPCLSDAGSVDAYGRFQVCLLLRHPATTYDLKSGSLREAVREFLPAVREMRAANPDYLGRCGRCFLKALCLQCPARSWSEHGTLDTPVEYLCAVTHAQAVSIGVLEEGEKAWTVGAWPSRVGRRAGPKKGRPRAGTENPAECGGVGRWKT
jgi:sulfatase maturation enzyme AslB (radical SAM superfamily)